VTCHQPADAMSLSAESARRQWERTGGKDPLFAAYDGSNCPTLPQAERASHSLLLERGLIRIERPWPVRQFNGQPVTPDFSIDVVRDPNGCNSGPHYGPAAGKISVYRRPRPVANMKYLLAVGFPMIPSRATRCRSIRIRASPNPAISWRTTAPATCASRWKTPRPATCRCCAG
jgi:hypothetical protein